MKLKKIIKYLEKIDNCKIFQCDVSSTYPVGHKEAIEVIYEGSVMDIPWYILDFYLYNGINGEAISSYHDSDTEKIGLCISVTERKIIE